jgi:hypothetical protein
MESAHAVRFTQPISQRTFEISPLRLPLHTKEVSKPYGRSADFGSFLMHIFLIFFARSLFSTGVSSGRRIPYNMAMSILFFVGLCGLGFWFDFRISLTISTPCLVESLHGYFHHYYCKWSCYISLRHTVTRCTYRCRKMRSVHWAILALPTGRTERY